MKMRRDFVQVSGENFVVNGEKIMLRGFSIGSWMNLEHFMVGLPGTDSMIRKAFADVYGKKEADEFFDSYVKEFLKEEDFQLLKKMGVNSIRLPFNYHYFIDDQNPDQPLEAGFYYLDRVLKLCEKYEIYAILDLHAVPGGQNPDWHADNKTGVSQFWDFACFRKQAVQLWKRIAARYANNRWIAGYDVLNEPFSGLTAEQFNGFYDEAIAAIREVDPDHVLLLEGDDFGRSFELFHEPQDPQIAYAVHYYPFVIDMDVLDENVDDEQRMKVFETVFYRQLRAKERFHRPIWCGETGLEFNRAQSGLYKRMIEKTIDLCETNNISWSLWTYKDAQVMGIMFPTDESDWMKLVRNVAKTWSHHGEMERSAEIMNWIEKEYYEPFDPDFWYRTEFRIRSILHAVAVEQTLKTNLKAIPWEEMKQYPKSFACENCHKYDDMIQQISELISRY